MGGVLAPIEVTGAVPEEEQDLFGDFRRLVPIIVGGVPWYVPENNNLLRALQYLELKHGCVKMEWARFCWNDSTGCCTMLYREYGGEACEGRACRVEAVPGLEVIELPEGGAHHPPREDR